MPVAPTYPGVYVEEIPSGVRTISGVSTSVAAFVDFFARGPLNKAVQVFGFADFEREFGGLHTLSEASYGVQQFFLNGGGEAHIVRVASADDDHKLTAAQVRIAGAITGGSLALSVTAVSEGVWGNSLRVRVDPAPVAGEFNLTISEVAASNGRFTLVRQEVFRNLSMIGARANFVDKVVNDANTGSKLVSVTASGTDAPLSTGTGALSGAHAAAPTIPAPAPPVTAPSLKINIGKAGATASLPATLTGAQPLTAIAPALQAAIHEASPANPHFAGAIVTVEGNRLRVLAGPGQADNRVTFANDGSDTTATTLKLTTDATANVGEYVLGGGAVTGTAQLGGEAGADGLPPDATALIGNPTPKTGIHALEDVDNFNLLCLPRVAELADDARLAVLAVAQTYCETRRAFLIVDTPPGIDEPTEIKTVVSNTPRHRNAALYYPRVKIPDPLNNFRLRSVGASGTIAGLYARTDSTRGVWKAPAGTEATLRNVGELEDVVTDPENGALNPLAINCLRTFPVYGTVAWGARTLEGSDQQASEWKYVPVRRLALFLEESLYRGTKWVVFEPNDEPLWAQIRLNIGAFLQNLFRQGAFQGRTPREAYFVKCDRETTTQTDINGGVVNIVVGFAPLKPAEFVIVKIQQMSGQIDV